MRKINLFRMTLLTISCISTISIVILLCIGKGTIEYLLSIISITVTCILGITTYKQVDSQLKLDMIDKTPLLTCKMDNEDEIHTIADDNSIQRQEIKFVHNKCFLYAEPINNVHDFVVIPITFKNNSTVVIKKIDIFDWQEETGEYKEIENYGVTFALSQNPNNENFDFMRYLNERYRASTVYGIEPGGEFQAYFLAPFNAEKISKKIRLNIETVHGYRFEEFLNIDSIKVGFIPQEGILYLVCKNDIELNPLA